MKKMERHLTLVPQNPVLQTNESPTRYIAFQNHKTWIEHILPQKIKGFEWAIYYEPYLNTVHSNTVDAILIEILYHEDNFKLTCFATAQEKDRKEFLVEEIHETYEQARCASYQLLKKAQRFVTSSTPNPGLSSKVCKFP